MAYVLSKSLFISNFNTAHLLPKDLNFDHGVAKLASFPGHFLTSLRPCQWNSPCFAFGILSNHGTNTLQVERTPEEHPLSCRTSHHGTWQPPPHYTCIVVRSTAVLPQLPAFRRPVLPDRYPPTPTVSLISHALLYFFRSFPLHVGPLCQFLLLIRLNAQCCCHFVHSSVMHVLAFVSGVTFPCFSIDFDVHVCLLSPYFLVSCQVYVTLPCVQGGNQLVFSGRGKMLANLLLHLTSRYVFANLLGGGNCPVADPLVTGPHVCLLQRRLQPRSGCRLLA